ncbi:class 3 adenylate cyclase [Arthrobacter pigmenti]|uniref:Class 3 adenylate cyclase n=1 Tax=Arthrobacter pigmenti TaxID=271432 RepID=A0A846RVJ4_9MICC|nr:class 3 adenylate cyclase [Arthrobacter pigmenti]
MPTSDSVNLSNGGVWLKAVYLYTDMADSSGLAKKHTATTAAQIVRAFLAAVTRVIRDNKGEIRSYDGDRVMAIFIGDGAASVAAKTALEIKWAVDELVRPSLSYRLNEYLKSSWVLSSRTGIDMGDALIVRAGVRNNNDLVSIGDAPNIAAKLSELHLARTIITDRMWNAMSYSTCYSRIDGKAMWSIASTKDIGGGRVEQIRTSNYGIQID